MRVLHFPRAAAARRLVPPPAASARRSSAGSSCATRTARWASCGSRARAAAYEPVAEPYARAARVRDQRRATACASARARDAPEPPRGDLVQAGPLLVAGGAVAFDAADDREGFSRGRRPVRLRHHRRPPSARGARDRRARRDRGRLRRAPLRRRRRALDARAGRRSCSSSAPRARSTSTAAARRRSCTAGICSTARTRRRTSRRRSRAAIVSALAFEPARDAARGSWALAVLAAVALTVGVLAALRRAATSSTPTASRTAPTQTLRSDAVSAELARRLTDAAIRAQPDLIARAPAGDERGRGRRAQRRVPLARARRGARRAPLGLRPRREHGHADGRRRRRAAHRGARPPAAGPRAARSRAACACSSRGAARAGDGRARCDVGRAGAVARARLAAWLALLLALRRGARGAVAARRRRAASASRSRWWPALAALVATFAPRVLTANAGARGGARDVARPARGLVLGAARRGPRASALAAASILRPVVLAAAAAPRAATRVLHPPDRPWPRAARAVAAIALGVLAIVDPLTVLEVVVASARAAAGRGRDERAAAARGRAGPCRAPACAASRARRGSSRWPAALIAGLAVTAFAVGGRSRAGARRPLQRPGRAVRPHARPGRVRRHPQLDGRRRRARLAVRRPGRRHRRAARRRRARAADRHPLRLRDAARRRHRPLARSPRAARRSSSEVGERFVDTAERLRDADRLHRRRHARDLPLPRVLRGRRDAARSRRCEGVHRFLVAHPEEVLILSIEDDTDAGRHGRADPRQRPDPRGLPRPREAAVADAARADRARRARARADRERPGRRAVDAQAVRGRAGDAVPLRHRGRAGGADDVPPEPRRHGGLAAARQPLGRHVAGAAQVDRARGQRARRSSSARLERCRERSAACCRTIVAVDFYRQGNVFAPDVRWRLMLDGEQSRETGPVLLPRASRDLPQHRRSSTVCAREYGSQQRLRRRLHHRATRSPITCRSCSASISASRRAERAAIPAGANARSIAASSCRPTATPACWLHTVVRARGSSTEADVRRHHHRRDRRAATTTSATRRRAELAPETLDARLLGGPRALGR